MGIFKIVVGGVSSLLSSWFQSRTEISKAKIARQLKELDAQTDYDTTAQRNMKDSLKDEYLILLHTFPIWGYAIPSEQLRSSLDIVWSKLNEAPDWWWIIYVGMVVSTFGLRFMWNQMKTIRGKK